MSKKKETLKDILENAYSILHLNDFYSRDMQYWEDDQKNILSVSPACEKITGYTSEEFIENPKLIEEIIHPEDRAVWEKRCKDVHVDDVRDVQFRVKHKSGRIIYIEHESQKLYNNKGEFIGFRSSNRDITQRKLTDEIIYSSSTVLFLWKNEEGYPVEFVSPNVENLLGYTTEEFLTGKVSYNDLIHPECLERVAKETEINLRERDENFKHKPYRIRTKDNKIKWVSDVTTVKTDSEGNITHFHGVVSDITEQIESELELKRSEQRFAFSLDAANIGSWELNIETWEFHCSSQIQPILGLTKELSSITYDEYLKRIDSDDKQNVIDTINKAISEKSGFRVEHRIIREDGEVRWVRQQGKVFLDSQNKSTKMYGIVRDVTNRVLANKALLESEQRYKTLVENSPNGIVIHSNEIILYANPMAVAMFAGTADKDYVGTKISDLIHPDYIDEVRERLRKPTGGLRRRAFFEMKAKRIDNTILDIAVASTVINFEGSNAVQTVFYDITKTKKAEEALRKNEEIYRSVFENSPLGIFHFDSDGTIVSCNEEYARILGAPRDKLIGINIVKTAKNKKIIKTFNETMKNGSGYYEGEYTSIVSGKKMDIVVRANAIFSDGNKFIGGVGLLENIANRKKNEKLQKALFNISEEASKTTSMNELYRKLHKIIQTLMPADNLYVAIHNTKTNIISFPYHVDEYDVLSLERPYGNGLTEYILKNKKSQILTSDFVYELEKKGIVELNGAPAKVWVGIYLEFEGKYKGVLALQDYNNFNAYTENDVKILQFVSTQIVKVLDKKYADKRLRESIKDLSEAKQELELINKNKDRFFSIIAHDLRAPFNTLLGVTQMISGDMDNMSLKEVKEISSIIHSSTNNLFKLIESLLNWSRLQMGTFHINPIELEIKDAVLDTIEVLKYSAREKEIVINNNIFDYRVFADDKCVKTVLRNLLSNAIKFTYRNGSISIDSYELEEYIQISVEDNGVGMDKDTVTELFSITKKTSTVGTENEKGTGLGLILCKDLIEKNNGKIWVESVYGKGSKFSFTLPKAKGKS